jgi:hypothetical protein
VGLGAGVGAVVVPGLGVVAGLGTDDGCGAGLVWSVDDDVRGGVLTLW